MDDTEEQESTRPGFYGLLKELETERSKRFMRHCQEPFVMPALCGHPPPPAMLNNKQYQDTSSAFKSTAFAWAKNHFR